MALLHLIWGGALTWLDHGSLKGKTWSCFYSASAGSTQHRFAYPGLPRMCAVGAEVPLGGRGGDTGGEGPVHQCIPVVHEVLGSQMWLLAYQLNQSVVKTGDVLEGDWGVTVQRVY